VIAVLPLCHSYACLLAAELYSPADLLQRQQLLVCMLVQQALPCATRSLPCQPLLPAPPPADFIEIAADLLNDAEGLIAQYLNEIEAAEASGIEAAGGQHAARRHPQMPGLQLKLLVCGSWLPPLLAAAQGTMAHTPGMNFPSWLQAGQRFGGYQQQQQQHGYAPP